MDETNRSIAEFAKQGITLNQRKRQRQSLNARMLWAIQHHDEEEQKRIKSELDEIQKDIDYMMSHGGR